MSQTRPFHANAAAALATPAFHVAARIASPLVLFLAGTTATAAAEPQTAAGPAIVSRARRPTRSPCAPSASTAAQDRRPPRRRGLHHGRADHRLHPAGAATKAQPATEKTEAWILFDDDNLYISARCWDSHPEREVANELRRDNGNILGNENFTFVIDTFHDRRNGYLFQTNPLGALRDMTVTDDQQNSALERHLGREDRPLRAAAGRWRWRFPFKSLRYRGSGPQTWGINLRRLVKWKNEISYLSLVPAALGTGGVSRMASAATLVGLETPAQSKNLELKPYAVVVADDRSHGGGAVRQRLDGNAGFDFKYGLTRSLIVDATYRTDFAQVEEDLQQVNLTRFSLFFPEKRDFFIEGQGIFDFGGVQARQHARATCRCCSSAGRSA